MSINSKTFINKALQHTSQPLPLNSFLGPMEKAALRAASPSFQALFPEQTSAVVKAFRGIEAISKIDRALEKYIMSGINPPKEVLDQWAKIILSNQDEINLPLHEDPRQGTILHLCAKVGFLTGLIPLIAQCGADFTIREKTIFENTPLLWAIANASNATAMQIIKYSPQKAINMQSKLDGVLDNSPLHLAIGKGYGHYSADGESLTHTNFELMQELVSRGADINARNRLGNTPLHLACIRRDFPTIEYLLAHGARTDIVNNEGKSAKDLLSLSYDQACLSLYGQVRIFSLFKNLFDISLQGCSLCFALQELRSQQ